MRVKEVLYITEPDTHLSKNRDSVAIKLGRKTVDNVHMGDLSSIVCLSPTYISPPLAQACLDANIGVSFMSYSGRFLGRIEGINTSRAEVRLEQVKAHLDSTRSLGLAKDIVRGKIANQRHVLQRAARDIEGDAAERLIYASQSVRFINTDRATTHDEVRGMEGAAAATYFGVFGDLVRADGFVWSGRNRRPPKDPINALLSFSYALLLGDCLAALQSSGLDPSFGFLHTFKAGRPALALDLMEHLRPLTADRLVLTLLNNQQIRPEDFVTTESDAVVMSDAARKTVIKTYAEKKRKLFKHAELKQEIPYGSLMHVEAGSLLHALRVGSRFQPYHPIG